MTLTRSQAVAAAILVTQGIVSFLLAQPDIVLPPIVKVALGAAAVALSTLALFLRIQPTGPVVQVPGGGQQVIGDNKP